MDLGELVESQGTRIDIDAGRHVYRQGDDDHNVYLLRSGLLKAYYLSADGKETIKSFVLPGETISSLASAYRHQGCSFNLLSLEAATLVALDFQTLYAASQKDSQVGAAVITLLLDFALKKEQREREFLTESAAARYRLLLERAPEIEGRVTQKDIARYLGITPVALSRIRARMEGKA